MTRSDSASITLAKSTLIRLADSAREITCESGTVWITLDADLRDIVLEPGQRFLREGSTGAIAYALTPARMTVQHDLPVASRAPRRRWSLARMPITG